MTIFLQIVFALRLAYENYGFTHYDLHGGNVIVSDIPGGSRTLEYPWAKVTTSHYATIIDFGRSCFSLNSISYGKDYPKMSIATKPNFFYDIYFYLHRTADQDLRFHPDIHKISSFFVSNSFGPEIFKDMKYVANHHYNWDSFLSLLKSLPSCQSIMSSTEVSPMSFSSISVVSQQPNDPTYEELTRWLKVSTAPQVRGTLLSIITQDRIRLEKIQELLSILTESGEINSKLNNLDFGSLRESQHEHFRQLLEKVMKESKLSGYRPLITSVIKYYQTRINLWTQLLRERFGG
jgi:hypothetical protein